MPPTRDEQPVPAPRPLRVGMIFLTDPDSRTQLSGMPYAMAAALRDQGVTVVPLCAGDHAPGDAQGRDLGTRVRGRVRRELLRRTPPGVRGVLDDLRPARTRRLVLDRAARLSARVQAQLGEHDLDLLFGACISSALYQLQTDLPVVYFSDATSRLINSTYPRLAARGRARHDALEDVERAALARVTRAAFAAPATYDSAVEHLGVPPERSGVIPMGAHVVPADPAGVRAPAEAPTARDCRLLVIAADPVRKRVDLAVRAAEALRRRGVHATLTVVGPGTPRARASPAVEFAGPLRLSNPEDVQRLRALLRSSHLQLLPSVGEAFGIAPAESAHFARPAVVSDAGGLPFVVRHDETGVVLPVDADHHRWADAVAALVRDPERYRRYSIAALARARTDLNWSAWAARTVALMHEAIAPPTPAAR